MLIMDEARAFARDGPLTPESESRDRLRTVTSGSSDDSFCSSFAEIRSTLDAESIGFTSIDLECGVAEQRCLVAHASYFPCPIGSLTASRFLSHLKACP